jgi:hypothetical protein
MEIELENNPDPRNTEVLYKVAPTGRGLEVQGNYYRPTPTGYVRHYRHGFDRVARDELARKGLCATPEEAVQAWRQGRQQAVEAARLNLEKAQGYLAEAERFAAEMGVGTE